MSDVEEPIEEPVASDVEDEEASDGEEEFVAVGGATEVKLFGKWSFDDIEVRDISLVDYIAVKGDHATYLPHTAGRYQKKRFRKASCPIVERLACCLMRKGRNSGKKLMAVRIVQHTLEIILFTIWSIKHDHFCRRLHS
jgi:small subunit ribosomal protein S5e